jgi:hypothetical protein
MTKLIAKDVGRMEIKIEQIDRAGARAACNKCARSMPHLHFYISAKSRKFKDFGECLTDTRKTMTDWAEIEDGFPQEFHSFNGGKSRAEFLSQDNVKRAADRAWAEDAYELSAHRVECHSLDDEHIINLCTDKNFRGFIKADDKS